METLAVLIYDYIPDVIAHREPHREEHLELLRKRHAEGHVRMAGALGDPPSGGLLVFESIEAAEEFVGVDPYVSAGLVTEHRIVPWTVVIP